MFEPYAGQKVRRHIFASIVVTAVALGTSSARCANPAPEYPTRAITLVVPFTAGGAFDVVARILGQHISQTLGQPVIVDNISGAGGTIAAARVARAAPDGYTLLVGSLGTQVASVGTYDNLPYDPRRDFEPVMLVSTAPMVLIVRKDLPSNTLQEFIAYCKSAHQSAAIGNAGVGSVSHLAFLLFRGITNSKVQDVPYRGLPQAETDLIGGRIDAMFDQTVSAAGHIRSGAVKALAVTSTFRTPVLPDVPTSVEAGLPGLQTVAWAGFFAPKATPNAIIARINAALAKAAADETVVARLAELGADVPPPTERTPETLDQRVNSDLDKWPPLIRSFGAEK